MGIIRQGTARAVQFKEKSIQPIEVKKVEVDLPPEMEHLSPGELSKLIRKSMKPKKRITVEEALKEINKLRLEVVPGAKKKRAKRNWRAKLKKKD